MKNKDALSMWTGRVMKKNLMLLLKRKQMVFLAKDTKAEHFIEER